MKIPAQILLLGSLLLLCFCSPVIAADVVLNEFLPNPPGSSESDTEWIELYNDSSSPVDISGWKLDDDPSSAQAQYIIPSDTTIDAHGFKVFKSSVTEIQLSNSEDSVRLLGPDNGELDVYTYAGTTEDVSIGRSTDGGGSWLSCAAQTKEGPNNCPLPTSSPTPTPTPVPTSTPTSTPSPTLTPTPRPTSTITPTPTTVLAITQEVNHSVSVSTLATEAVVLGEAVSEHAESPSDPSFFQSLHPLVITFALLGLGLALLSGVITWQRFQKMRREEEKE